MRGLKLNPDWMNALHHPIAPFTGAWIETNPISALATLFQSHPSRVRGLKLAYEVSVVCVQLSHPSRVRGLKQQQIFQREDTAVIAPFTGAWIETGKR